MGSQSQSRGLSFRRRRSRIPLSATIVPRAARIRPVRDRFRANPFNPDQYRRDCFTQYRDMKAMDPVELLGILPTCQFGKFCSKKYLAIVHPKMEESLFGNLEQHDQWRWSWGVGGGGIGGGSGGFGAGAAVGVGDGGDHRRGRGRGRGRGDVACGTHAQSAETTPLEGHVNFLYRSTSCDGIQTDL